MQAVCPNLQSLWLSSVNIQKIWQLPSSLCFQKLEYFTVKGCHNLKYLFPSFMLKHFERVQYLAICDCEMMEEVMFMEEGLTEEERMSPFLFPQLDSLELKDLPKLSRFCYDTYFEFPRLRFLTLANCSSLKTFLAKETENTQGDELKLVSPLFSEKVISSSNSPFSYPYISIL